MSEIKVNKLTPRTNCGTVTLGDSGDTIALGSGATQTGFGRTGAVDWDTTVQTSTITATNGKGYFVNTTSGGITANLPAGAAGSIVAFKDYANTFDTGTLTLVANGSEKIGGSTDDALITTEGIALTLVYIDSTKGWLVVDSGLQSEAPGAQYVAACGGNTTITCGNYKIHVFTGPGTLSVTDAGNSGGSNTVDYLVVGGGASGGNGGPADESDAAGGGGGGGMRYSISTVPAGHPIANACGIPVTVTSYSVAVGAGGASQPSYSSQGNVGAVSTFHTITSAGGGGGGGGNNAGDNGGSGGGGSGGGQGTAYTGGTGNQPPVSPSQGNNGGTGAAGIPVSPDKPGAGGGGAGAVGGNVTGGGNSGQGTGGDGAYVPGPWFGPTAPSYGGFTPAPLTPNGRYFSGGGGGSSPQSLGSPYGNPGGAGGGGGYPPTYKPCGTLPGDTNSGGGGAGSAPSAQGAAGGSGFVAIRYKFQ